MDCIKFLKNRKSFLAILSFITCFVFCIDFKKYSFNETNIFNKLYQILPTGNNFMWLFLVVGIFFIYQYAFKIQVQRKTKITLAITSTFFASFTLIGILCETFERWSIDLALFFILLITSFAYFFIIYAILKIIFYHLFENNEEKISKLPVDNQSKILTFFDNHTFVCTFFITLICWLPIIIIFFPGWTHYDGCHSISLFLGFAHWSNHHPVLISLLMGSCVNIGKLFGNGNLSIFLYTILLSTISILTFCNIQSFLKKIKASYIFRFLILLYFAIFPLWLISGYSLLKDGLYCMIVVNFTIELAHIILNPSEYLKSKSRWMYFVFLCILTCFTRNNGVYILFFVIIVLIFFYRKRMTITNQLKIISPLFVGIFLFSFCIHFLYPTLDIWLSGKGESSSIFCQQIGRYLKYYKSDLTDKEKNMLKYTFVDWENIGPQHYNPIISDPVKGRLYNKNNKLKKLWLTFLIKKPLVYFEAFFYHTASYYSLAYNKYRQELLFVPVQHYNGFHSSGVTIPYLKKTVDYIGFHFLPIFEKSRKTYQKFPYFIKHIPGIGLLYNCSFYTYIMVLCFIAVILYGQKKKLIIFIPSIVTFLVALASPLNGSLRYFLPILAITPILIGITLMKENINENSNNFTGV